MYDGKTLKYILLGALGLFILITGIGFLTGYWPGLGEKPSWLIIALGGVITLMSLGQLTKR